MTMKSKTDFAALIARVQKTAAAVKQQKAAQRTASVAKPQAPPKELPPTIPTIPTISLPSMQEEYTGAVGMHGEAITYNSAQQEFIRIASSGENCVLVGAAGTGKTTCTQGALQALMQTGKIPILQSDGHKHLVDGSPGITIISYTRRAVNNIRKVQSEDLKNCCVTAHKLLEYAPIFYEVEDPETGKIRNTMRFEATRNEGNPLPDTMYTIVVEEGSMLGIDLFQEINLALQHKVQWIFIGDIQQLPPVFGPAILGFKMLELPVIELTEVYRQALESPIIKLAHRILSGKPIPTSQYSEWNIPGKLTIHPWKKKLKPEHALLTLGANRLVKGKQIKGFFLRAIDEGVYNPGEDMILIPYNKACGTIEINKQIANYLARKHHTVTHEVIAGFTKHYLSEGDKVLYDREDAEILSIEPNLAYTGTNYHPASMNLDYWGHNPKFAEERATSTFKQYDVQDVDVDFLLEQASASEERVKEASHNIMLRLLDSDTEITIQRAGEVNSLILGYALTVHKAQGSEWNKVFLVFHHSHATMLQRELLYTAVTRAREELYIICEPETFTKGIQSQRIKGNTIEEKAEFFKGKLDKNGEYS